MSNFSHTFGAGLTTKSPCQINREQECEAREKTRAAHNASNTKGDPGTTKEHDKATSHTGRQREISLGPSDSGLVPANPFASLAQEGFLHAHPEKLGAEKLAEFDAATKGKKLPKRVSKAN